MDDKLVFRRKKLKGDDGYQVISVRVSKVDLEQLDILVEKTNESRNALINAYIKYGIAHSTVIEDE